MRWRLLPEEHYSHGTRAVLLVLLATTALQCLTSSSMDFGRLDALVGGDQRRMFWDALRIGLMALVLLLWIARQGRGLLWSMLCANGVLTLGLVAGTADLIDALFVISSKSAVYLIDDVILMSVSNVLVFAVWYWIMDPPGLVNAEKHEGRWDFLFPQREQALPHFDDWTPGFIDYLFVSFETLLTFGPADVVPLTRRAKAMMMLQTSISVVLIVVVAAGAVGFLGTP